MARVVDDFLKWLSRYEARPLLRDAIGEIIELLES
jgi:hypothetical protein